MWILAASACAGEMPPPQDPAPDCDRDRLSLNGAWEVARGKGEPWARVTVPGRLLPDLPPEGQKDVGLLQARRAFSVDARHASRDAVLKWGGIRFGATVFINGRRIAQHTPMGPHTVMLPKGSLREGENQILLEIPGFGAIPRSASGFPLFPSGSAIEEWGNRTAAIYDDIWLEFYRAAYLKRILAVPSLEKRSVTFRVWLDGVGRLPEQVKLVAEVGSFRGSAKAASDASPAEVTVGLKDVKPWTPRTPHLYEARLRAEAGGRACDDVRFRFGMREIKVEEGRYRLNGEPFRFRGANLVEEWLGRLDGKAPRQDVKRYLVDESRAMSLNSFRTHTLPPPTSWLDVCDENGVMILAEMPMLYNGNNFLFSEKELEQFHDNALLDAAGWVTRLWNHPSVAVWVLSNESLQDGRWESGALRDHVRTLDPTRPCMRTGEVKWGTAETVDMHLCNNYSQGAEGDAVRIIQDARLAKDPARTLTNTEYMNSGAPLNPKARWLGREDHPDVPLTYAELAMEHTEAMRRADFDGIFPYQYSGWTRLVGNGWRKDYPTPMAAALHSAMAPVLASLDLFDRNFRSGEEVESVAHLINELHEDVPVALDVYVTPKHPLFVPDRDALDAAVFRKLSGPRKLLLKAGSIREERIRWKVPEREGTYYLAAVVQREGDLPVVSQRVVRSVAPGELRKTDVVLVGGDDQVAAWLKERMIPYRSEADAGAAGTMLVSDGSRVSDAMLRYAESGGRLVVLAPPGWSCKEPLGIEIGRGARSSRAFPYAGTDHPLLSAIDPRWLQRMNGLNGAVADSVIVGDAGRGSRKLLWIEDPGWTVALSVPLGRGEVIVCTLELKQRLGRRSESYDPAAERILLGLLQRGEEARPRGPAGPERGSR